MINNRTCPVCGKKIKQCIDTQARQHNKYCSEDCYYYSISPIYRVAKDNGITPAKLITDMLNTHGSAQVAAELIGVSVQVFNKWKRKFKIEQVWRASACHQ